MGKTYVDRHSEFSAEPTICDDIRDGILDIAGTSIDNFTGVATPEIGHHTVRISSWELIPSKEIVRRHGGKLERTGEWTKEYVLLNLTDTVNGLTYENRLYSKGVPFFMRNAAYQTCGAVMGMKLSQVLKYFGTHDLDIWARWDDEYGVQINYYDADETRS